MSLLMVASQGDIDFRDMYRLAIKKEFVNRYMYTRIYDIL